MDIMNLPFKLSLAPLSILKAQVSKSTLLSLKPPILGDLVVPRPNLLLLQLLLARLHGLLIMYPVSLLRMAGGGMTRGNLLLPPNTPFK